MLRTIVSGTTNPFANLALETVLFHHRCPQETLLYIYFNEPCVVIGRNQNPWSELDLRSELPLLRRKSGGGAVVHDLGNANFCVQRDKSLFSRTAHLEMLVRAFPHLKLQINSRNDLVMPTPNNELFKVSGSSYKLEKSGSYHHATLLLNADLPALGQALRPPESQGVVLTSGGTASVRSPVANTKLSVSQFLEGCLTEFRKMYGPTNLEIANKDWFETEEVQQEMKEITSWDWIYGKAPKFTTKLSTGEILHVEKGIVVKCEPSGGPHAHLVGSPMPYNGVV